MMTVMATAVRAHRDPPGKCSGAGPGPFIALVRTEELYGRPALRPGIIAREPAARREGQTRLTPEELTPEERESILQRRGAALERLDEGHRVLLKSLEGIDAEEAFLGQRWSVRDVLLHLDSERYVDALEKIARGEMEMLPPFSSREAHFRRELEQQEATHRRFRALLTGLTPEQLARPATPPNPENAYPGLTLLELLERSAGHEAGHARQIELTRRFVADFRSRDRALNVVALGDGDPSRLSPQVKDMLNMADCVAGSPEALAAVGHIVRGVQLAVRPGNREELVNRAARETHEGLWVLVCVMGDGGDGDETVALARRHAGIVVVHRATLVDAPRETVP